jgi:hypothetical protein
VKLISADGEAELLAFDIVQQQAADFEAGFLSISTPLARAIVGRPAGSEVSYLMGDVVKVRILSVARSQRMADHDATADREARTREAVSVPRRTTRSIGTDLQQQVGRLRSSTSRRDEDEQK